MGLVGGESRQPGSGPRWTQVGQADVAAKVPGV